MELEVVCPHCDNPNYYEEDEDFMSEYNVIEFKCNECEKDIYFTVKKSIVVDEVAKNKEELNV